MSPIKTFYLEDHQQMTRSIEFKRFGRKKGQNQTTKILPNFLTANAFYPDHATSKLKGAE